MTKLGGKPAAKPARRFDDVIAAGPEKILRTAATVENLGAAAYLGQAPRRRLRQGDDDGPGPRPGEAVPRPVLTTARSWGSRRRLEDTGVSAYNGAAPQIRSRDVLAAAGSIVQVEGRHAALIRLMRGEDPAPDAFDPSLDKQRVLMAVEPFVKA